MNEVFDELRRSLAEGHPVVLATVAATRGSRIAFLSDRDRNSEIYVMYSDGSGQTRLTNGPADDQSPAWSPDGSRIAFFRSQPDGTAEIYVMNVDDSGPTRLAVGSEPVWQPQP